MSQASKQARAERRAEAQKHIEVTGVEFDQASGKTAISLGSVANPKLSAEIDPHTMQILAPIVAMAVLPDGGGFRLARIELPPSIAERYAASVSEPEVLAVQLGLAAQALEDVARGEGVDEAGVSRGRKACPKCGQQSLVRHPSKPVEMCAACSHRIEVDT